uniref:Transcription initiation factor TFIID subunit 12 n=1 Tax=Rhabditophanes sp. KR3021 TaxID=114890 RepID=A0AC35TKE6_9BILA
MSEYHQSQPHIQHGGQQQSHNQQNQLQHNLHNQQMQQGQQNIQQGQQNIQQGQQNIQQGQQNIQQGQQINQQGMWNQVSPGQQRIPIQHQPLSHHMQSAASAMSYQQRTMNPNVPNPPMMSNNSVSIRSVAELSPEAIPLNCSPGQIKRFVPYESGSTGSTVYISKGMGSDSQNIKRTLPLGYVLVTLQPQNSVVFGQPGNTPTPANLGSPQVRAQQFNNHDNQSIQQNNQGNSTLLRHALAQPQTPQSIQNKMPPNGPYINNPPHSVGQRQMIVGQPMVPQARPISQQHQTMNEVPQFRQQQQQLQQPQMVSSPPKNDHQGYIVPSPSAQQQRKTPQMVPTTAQPSPAAPPVILDNKPKATDQVVNFDNVPIMTREDLREFTKTVDDTELVEDDVLDSLIEIADDFLDSLLEKTATLCKHRNGIKIEAKDVDFVLERYFNITVPPNIPESFLPSTSGNATNGTSSSIKAVKNAEQEKFNLINKPSKKI